MPEAAKQVKYWPGPKPTKKSQEGYCFTYLLGLKCLAQNLKKTKKAIILHAFGVQVFQSIGCN